MEFLPICIINFSQQKVGKYSSPVGASGQMSQTFLDHQKINTALGDMALPRGGLKDPPWVDLSAKLLAFRVKHRPFFAMGNDTWKAQISGKNKQLHLGYSFRKSFFHYIPKKWLKDLLLTVNRKQRQHDFVGLNCLFKSAKITTWVTCWASIIFLEPKSEKYISFWANKIHALGSKLFSNS